MKFDAKYFILSVVLLCIEVLIALFIHDDIIRPYIGDVLVVMLIYSFLRTFLTFSVIATVIFVFAFSVAIEFCQYLNMIEKVGLEKSKLAKIILGNSFSWIDIVCYTSGIIIILLAEKINETRQKNKNRNHKKMKLPE